MLTSASTKAKLRHLYSPMTDSDVSEVNVVLTADVPCSIEAISDSLTKLSTDRVTVPIVGSGVGGLPKLIQHLQQRLTLLWLTLTFVLMLLLVK